MFDLSRFRLQDMTACSAALRRLGAGASSIETAADRITRYLYTNLTTGPDADPACVLIRLFKTHPYGRLAPELQTLVDGRLGKNPASPDMKCLTLLASTGAVPGWNNPALSSQFRVIPLAGPEAIAKLPMFSQLFAQFHGDLPFLNTIASPLLLAQHPTTFNVFHVPEARNSRYVPGQQEFVVPFGVQSVLGFGNLLPTREMFAVILFTNIAVPSETAELFKPFALSTELTLAPFDHEQLILPAPPHTPRPAPTEHGETLASVKHRVATLESILTVQEQAVEVQSVRLETSLSASLQHARELQAESLRFETLSDSSPIGIFQTDANGDCLYANAAWQQIAGLSLAASLGRNGIQAIALEDRDQVIRQWDEAVRRGEEFELEFRIRRPDGTIRWVHSRAHPLRNDRGEMIGHVGTTEDITERKQAEQALRESEARLQEAQAMAHLGNWELDLVRNRLLWSDEIFRIFEIDKAQFGASYEAFLDTVHPDDRVLVNDAYRQSVESRTPYEIVHRLQMPDGRIKYVQECGETYYDGGGRPLRSVGTVQDITERREGQLQLQCSQALLNSVFEHLPHMVFVKDARTLRFVEFNKAGERLTGFLREELLGKSDYDFFPRDEADFFTEKDRAVLASGSMLEIPEEEIQTKHRGVRILQTKKVPLYDTHGIPQYLLGISEDITDRKAAEAQFKQVFESSYIGMLMVAEDGRITLANPRIEETFGYRRDELIGQPVEVLLPERFRTTHHGQRMAFVASGASRPMAKGRELHGCRKDGGEFPVEIGLTPVNTSQGPQVLASITDITERKQNDASRFRLQQAIDHGQDGMALLDSDGRYLYMNPAHATIFGYTSEELLGHGWQDLFPAEWAALVEQLYFPTLLQTGHWQGELVARKKTGDAFDIDVALTLLTDPRTNVQTFLWTCRDISPRKQMERDLLEAKSAAESSARAKSAFLATMSHEIRTPMNGVLGMTSLLLDTSLTAEQREYVETLKHSGQSLLTILNDILDFSKIEAGKLELEPIPFDLRAALDQVLDVLVMPAQEKHLELIGLVNADVPALVVGDPGRVKQILANLLNNAIKFTETGEVSVVVSSASVSAETVTLHVDVTDTGIGIDASAQSRLFKSFSQADTSTARRFGGTGLGLAICKQLVELMQGRIDVESTPGQGSRFWFEIQLGYRHDIPLIQSPLTDLRGKRLCILDDNALNRRILGQYAARWQMDACMAERAEDALALLRRERQAGRAIDAALVDIQLAVMSGLALITHMKDDPLLQDIPVILLTSVGRRGDGKAAQDAGAAAYLTKPIRERQLADCIRLVLAKPRQADNRQPLITRHTLSEATAQTRHHLLVVDDNLINQKVAVKMLEKLGYRVDVASNGNEALAALTRHHYNLVFMDCQMPELDGFETTRMIRTHEQPGTRLPIIAMTANAMAGDREHCLASGMDDFVSKPVKRQDLHRVLTQWLPPSDDRAAA